MAKEIIYKSVLAPFIEGFVAEKKACGYKYSIQSVLLKYFDDYWIEQGYQDTFLSFENLEGWLQQRETENAGYLRNRIGVIIEFAKYLNGIGHASYIPTIESRYEVPVRHILTKPELKELFFQIDTYKPRGAYKANFVRMSNEYPILFRILFLEGMRITETCSLALRQVDLEEGVITILDGKGNKDRLVYLDDDLAALCRDYIGYLTRILGEEPKWLFPGERPEEHVGVPTVTAMFNSCWKKTSFAATCNKKPTVHDLRHTFTTVRINKWAEQDISFEEMLPYLCKHLGHKKFDETYYYFHVLEDSYNVIRKKDKTSNDVIPEVKRR